jgi:O-antigen ligase
MGIEKTLILSIAATILVAFTIVNFRKTLYAWILLGGVVGVPVLVVRESRLMFSELLIALLLSLWLLERKLNLGLISLPNLRGNKTNIEKSMWTMIIAFTLSTIFNILFQDPAVGGEHTFVLAKLMALFLYVASVMSALLISDTITSLIEIRRLCILMIILGLFVCVAQLQGRHGFLGLFPGHVAWPWMSVTLLFSFALAYFLFDKRFSKKLQAIIIFTLIAGHIFYSFFTGTATYKAPILVSLVIITVIFYHRYGKAALIFVSIAGILFLTTSSLLTLYVAQERQEGSLTRFDIWRHSLSITAEQPLFGIGPYNYYDYSIYVAAKKSRRDPRYALGVITSPHNQYVQILTETGLLGTGVFLWFLFELCKLIKSLISCSFDSKTNILLSALTAIILSRLAVGLVGDYLIPQYHNGGLQTFCSTIYFWISLGVLISLRRISITENQSLQN